MGLTFHKMQGLGNDFVLLDLRQHDHDLNASIVRRMADRKLGIGFDQLLVLRQAGASTALAAYEIWNTDGSNAAQCGNGARCIGLFLRMNCVSTSSQFVLESPSGPVTVRAATDGEFEVEMGKPSFDPARVPIDLAALGAAATNHWYQLDHDNRQLNFGAVNVGNPHCTLVVDDIDSAPVQQLGSWLGAHRIFPQGCNVGFAQINSRTEIRLRVFERGVGETQACGSGACAAAVLLCRAGLVDERVRVILAGGHLVIKWPGMGTGGSGASTEEGFRNVFMKGPADYVFKGEWND